MQDLHDLQGRWRLSASSWSCTAHTTATCGRPRSASKPSWVRLTSTLQQVPSDKPRAAPQREAPGSIKLTGALHYSVASALCNRYLRTPSLCDAAAANNIGDTMPTMSEMRGPFGLFAHHGTNHAADTCHPSGGKVETVGQQAAVTARVRPGVAGASNPEHFFVATQDRKLRATVDRVPGGASIFASVNGLHLQASRGA